jgi:hypothetical protein
VKPLVVVSSVIANKPHNGGNARMVLNWLEGLERLGIGVFFIEQIRSDTCVDDAGAPTPADVSANRLYFERVLAAHGFEHRSALLCDARDTLEGATVFGATADELCDLADEADLLINVSGHLAVGALKDRFRRKAYVDLDPGYTQIWHATRTGAARLAGHDVYFTVGQRVGTAGFPIPTDGITWRPIRQPIVLDSCAVTSTRPSDRFTTVASWRGAYSPIAYCGRTFGIKAHEFRKIASLPTLLDVPFEIALDVHHGDEKDRQTLQASGWRVVDPRRVADMPDDYCRYIEGSAAECSAVQGIYAHARSGWFSDRTARYLASGKPALVQDTGFCTPERSGEGLLVFDTLADAARGADRIARDYRGHADAARWLAGRYFDSDVEIGRVLEQAGCR